MKKHNNESIIFYFSIQERIGYIWCSILLFVGYSYFLFLKWLPKVVAFSSFSIIFFLVLVGYVFVIRLISNWFKRAINGVDFIITPQYIQKGTQRFFPQDIESIFINKGILAEIILIPPVYKRQPIVYRLLYRYGFLILGVFLLAVAVYELFQGYPIYFKLIRGFLLALGSIILGVYQYKNGKGILLNVTSGQQELLEQQLTVFCANHGIPLTD